MANFFRKFISNLAVFPAVKAQEEEEEMVDQQDHLREKCREEAHTKHLFERYQACNDRVNSRSNTAETCVEEIWDYLHALDHCVSATLFTKLK